MKKLLAVITLIVGTGTGFAWDFNDNDGEGSRPYKDTWGNSYKHQENLYKDSDGDGTINKYDYRDYDSSVQTKSQADWYQKKSKGW